MSTQSEHNHRPLLASELYARAWGSKCTGDQECHWCSAPCTRLWIHDDPPPMIGVKRSCARRPGSGYICVGCWLFRRKSVTLPFLDGTLKDRTAAVNHSLLFTDKETKSIRLDDDNDRKILYETLLNPPDTFCLALLNEPSLPNLLQLMVANDFQEIKMTTVLSFTLNGVTSTYTVDELRMGLRDGPQGRTPGVGLLMRLLGEYKLPEVKKSVGRPPKQSRSELIPLKKN